MDNKKFNIEVGLRIRQTREAKKMTREKFSELCGISDSFLADIERGKKSLSAQTLYKICSNANISPNYIVLGEDNLTDASAIVDMLKQLDEKYLNSAIGILKEFMYAINEKGTD